MRFTSNSLISSKYALTVIGAILALALLFVSASNPGPVAAQTHAGDRAALVALYNATGGANWIDKHNWLSDEPLGEWQGITTDDEGRVTQLHLWDNNLTGAIPAPLGDLSQLQELLLENNGLSGEIPSVLGSLSRLTELNLSGNHLDGSIPSALGNLNSLTVLDLDSNQLSGSIPSELGDLSNLRKLDLSANELSGAIPVELKNLSNLTILNLHTNQVSGEIPSELGNLSNLEELVLGDNQLIGTIPSSLGNLSNLNFLYMWNNQLSGEIPSELGKLSNLIGLALQDNDLTGELPSALGKLSNLEHMGLWGNQLTGEVPAWLGNLSNMKEIWFSGNRFTGTIPASLGKLSNLEDLHLSGNQLTGTIPSELSNLNNLEQLYLSGNEFTGCIPTALRDVPENDFDDIDIPFCDATPTPTPTPSADRAALVALYNATGGADWTDNTNWLSAIPLNEWYGVALDANQRVIGLSLRENGLSGSIPSDLGNLTNLRHLSLTRNQLTGTIPSQLGNLTKLQVLDLGRNNLAEGIIPSWLSGMTTLRELHLDVNNFSGNIPSQLGNLTNLEVLDLDDNRLTGEIPASFGSLTKMVRLELQRNLLVGAIPPALGALTNLEQIELAGNQFSGCIPTALRDVPENDFDELGLPFCDATQPLTGRIAFSSNRDGNHEIYVMNADGSDQTRLTNNSGTDWEPSWSPDGSRIAFSSNRDGNHEIYVMDSDGSNHTRLTNNSGTDWEPSWSPDGSRIAFSSDRDGRYGEIYAMDADGSNQTRLTDNSKNEGVPSWSPNGNRILFHSDRTGNWEIYVMDADGSNQTPLTSNGQYNAWPSWSPDGSRIAFESRRDGNHEIYVMDADGSNQTRLTSNSTNDQSPSWSPDGRRITFVSARDGNSDIYAMNADGSNQTNLTNHSSDDFGPNWTSAGGSPPAQLSFSLSIDQSVKTIEAGKPFELTVRMHNVEGSGEHGGISVSFPQLSASDADDTDTKKYTSDVADVQLVSPSNGSSQKVTFFDSTKKIFYRNDNGNPIEDNAKHLLVESDYSEWSDGDDRQLVLKITPNQAVEDGFKIRVRGWICEDEYNDCTRRPSQAGSGVEEDQQRYNAEVITVDVQPQAGECAKALSGDGEISVTGRWTDDCESTLPSPDDQEVRYARYYTFTLTGQTDVTVTLESSEDTFLYLRAGSAKDGAILCSDDDYGTDIGDYGDCAPIASDLGRSTDSGLIASLNAGDYTIEATTFESGTTGNFTLKVSMEGEEPPFTLDSQLSATSVMADDTFTLTVQMHDVTVSGATGGISVSFPTLTAASETDEGYSSSIADVKVVTADTTVDNKKIKFYDSGDSNAIFDSDDDEMTPDYLLVESDEMWAEEDDRTLKLQITPKTVPQGGEFNILVRGWICDGNYENCERQPGENASGVAEDQQGYDAEELTVTYGCTEDIGELHSTAITRDKQTWISDCVSKSHRGNYARYYNFRLLEDTKVKIDVFGPNFLADAPANIDPYLYLLDEDAQVVTENDDAVEGTPYSQLFATLNEGRYTVEATTKDSGKTGEFSVRVKALSISSNKPNPDRCEQLPEPFPVHQVIDSLELRKYAWFGPDMAPYLSICLEGAWRQLERLGREELLHPVGIAIIDEGLYKPHNDDGTFKPQNILQAIPRVKLPLRHEFDWDRITVTDMVSNRGNETEYETLSRTSHGTTVAGIIAAVNHQGNSGLAAPTDNYDPSFSGVVSSVPNLDYHIDFYEHTSKSNDIDFDAAIRALQAISNRTDIDVVNLSFGRHCPDFPGLDIVCDAIQGLWQRKLEDQMKNMPNVLFVAAAGNNGHDAKYATPADLSIKLDNVITVGSINSYTGTRMPSSNYGEAITVGAPGGIIYSLIPAKTDAKGNIVGINSPTNMYGTDSGTSVAAPMVTGVVAMLRAIDPDIRATEVVEIIKSTGDERVVDCTTDRGGSIKNCPESEREKWVLIDADAAVRELISRRGLTPKEPASPSFTLSPIMSTTIVKPDEPFVLTVRMNDVAGTASGAMGGISVSFPQLDSDDNGSGKTYSSSVADVQVIHGTTVSGVAFYRPGDKIHRASDNQQFDAKHLLVESAEVWSDGDDKTLQLLITPKRIGDFKILVRGWICDSEYEGCGRRPSEGTPGVEEDQQGHDAEVITLDVQRCVSEFRSNLVVEDSWTAASSCVSENRKADNAQDGAYAKYYTFMLDEPREVTITLESTEDTYLYLLRGTRKHYLRDDSNDDIDTDAKNYNSRIVKELEARVVYTIEATTWHAGKTGDFTLTVSGMGPPFFGLSVGQSNDSVTTDEAFDLSVGIFGVEGSGAKGGISVSFPQLGYDDNGSGSTYSSSVADVQVLDGTTVSGVAFYRPGDNIHRASDNEIIPAQHLLVESAESWKTGDDRTLKLRITPKTVPQDGEFKMLVRSWICADEYKDCRRIPAQNETAYYLEKDQQGWNAIKYSVIVQQAAAGAPDLAISSVSIRNNKTNVKPEEKFTFKATVVNIGTASVVENPTLHYYRSSDHIITTGDTKVASESVDILGPNETDPESEVLTAPLNPGEYYYGVCVDVAQGETATGNNCSRGIKVTVKVPPWFNFWSYGIPSSASANSLLTLSARMYNVSGVSGSGAKGGISVSFPSLTTESDDSISSDNRLYTSSVADVWIYSYTDDLKKVKFYKPGEDKIFKDDNGKIVEMTANNLLVELDDSWANGDNRTLKLRIKPKKTGDFKILVRGWICADGYTNCRRYPDSGTLDQQNYPVEVRTVSIQ